VRRAQLGEAPASVSSDAGLFDRPSEQIDDLVVSPEVGEVLERQVDRSGNSAGGAQGPKLVEFSLSPAHARTIHRRADAPLDFG
jgi:hypothetical protein